MSNSLRDDLYTFVGRELHEFAWKTGFPINPDVGRHCFFEAFREQGISVDHVSKERSVGFTLLWGGDLLYTEQHYDQILHGWHRSAPSSMNSFYDSILAVFDSMKDQIIKKSAERNWWIFRDNISKEIRKKMEDDLKPYFAQHHEHMLVPRSLKIPLLEKPRLFEETLKEYPLGLHEKVCQWKLENKNHGGVCAEYISEYDENNFTSYNHPSDSAMTEYFWGIYLKNLSKEKKYPLETYVQKARGKEKLNVFIRQQENIFVRGKDQWIRKHHIASRRRMRSSTLG